MPTSYTSLLGLALPVTGELSGTWGDTVNDYITQYLDAAVAGAQTISGSQTAVTLSKTTATSLSQAGSGATGSSQYQIINCTGNPASLLTITAPAASKVYLVLNSTSTSQSVKVVGAGPTTGVTMVSGEKALIAWDGSDFVKVASSVADGVTTFSAGTTGFTPSTATSGAVTLAGTLATTNGGTGLTTFTSDGAVYATSTSALTTGTLPVGSGGTGAASLTLNNVILGNGTSAVQFVAPGTTGNVLTSDGTTWSSQPVAASLLGQTDSATPFETALGSGAGASVTGVNNTLIGYNAGNAVSTGTNNTYLGFEAGKLTTTGSSNVAIGSSAISGLTTASDNVAVGRFAGQSQFTTNYNLTGSRNTTVGNYSLGGNMSDFAFSSTENAAVGYSAMMRPYLADYCVAVGAYSLGVASFLEGDYNTAAGHSSGRAVTTGTQNVLLGANAGYSGTNNLTTGSNNIIIGYNAEATSATVSNQATIGNASITTFRVPGVGVNITGTKIVIGGNAGTSGSGIAMGFLASQSSTGSNNIFLGDYSGRQEGGNTGGNNVFVGAFSGTGTGSFNVSTGNVGIGVSSMQNISSGDDNVTVGYLAGSSITTGGTNTVVGKSAAASGTNNLTTGTNNIIIGYNAEASSATVSNEVTIGNTSITSTRLRGMVQLNAALFEQATVSATAATGTINFDARTQSVLYYTSNASANWTLNVRGASGVSLDSVMTTGQSITLAFLVTNGATAYYQTALTVDGSSVTPKWQGGTAPTAGNASSIDAYVLTIIKTGAATFTALESQTQFK